MNYLCENTPAKKCDFRSGKVILRQEIHREQMEKLLDTGRTDLLDGFFSNRNGRRFKAFLVKQSDGKVGFEFAPRAGKSDAKPAANPTAPSKRTKKVAAPAPKKRAPRSNK